MLNVFCREVWGCLISHPPPKNSSGLLKCQWYSLDLTQYYLGIVFPRHVCAFSVCRMASSSSLENLVLICLVFLGKQLKMWNFFLKKGIFPFFFFSVFSNSLLVSVSFCLCLSPSCLACSFFFNFLFRLNFWQTLQFVLLCDFVIFCIQSLGISTLPEVLLVVVVFLVMIFICFAQHFCWWGFLICFSSHCLSFLHPSILSLFPFLSCNFLVSSSCASFFLLIFERIKPCPSPTPNPWFETGLCGGGRAGVAVLLLFFFPLKYRQPTPVLLPRQSRGQRNLVDYGPWGCKELDMTEATEHNVGQERAFPLIFFFFFFDPIYFFLCMSNMISASWDGFFVFWPYPAPCGILVPWLGVEPTSPALEADSFNH